MNRFDRLREQNFLMSEHWRNELMRDMVSEAAKLRNVPTQHCQIIADLLWKGARELDYACKEVSETKTRWISVKERLPEEDVPVLCIDSQNVQLIACFGWGEWWHPEIQADITHWQPLPPLPGEEVQG